MVDSGDKERSMGPGSSGLRTTQVRYLRELQKRHKLTASEMARLSQVYAERLDIKGLAFTHQAAWAWLNGTRAPRPEHRRALAMIFQVPIGELNRAFDQLEHAIESSTLLRPVTVRVERNDRTFEYRLTISGSIDLDKPALYRNWEELFQPAPVRLRRHMEKIHCSQFGWIHDSSVSPLVRYARSLVPLATERTALADVSSADKKIWFVYLPTGVLDFGVAYKEGPWLCLVKAESQKPEMRKYLLKRVDLIGHVSGKVLFHVDPL
jgi:transcriptional regulator with XRE-family HTH domain